MLQYKYQELPKKVAVWSNSDFAACGRTSISTSEEVIMLVSHCIKTHSQTQDTRASSSGESEFYGVIKQANMGIGIKSLKEDLGLHMKVQVNTDSSAARSISSRGGAG